MAALPAFDHETIENSLRALAVELGLKVGQFLGIVRVAVSGKEVAPPLFETLAILGRERCLARMELAEERLAQLQG